LADEGRQFKNESWRIVARVPPENLVSQSGARKLGAQPERETVYAGLVHTVFVKTR